MQHRALKACGLAVALLAVGGAPAMAASGDLDAYRVKNSKANLDKLAKAGFDVEEGIDRKRGTIDVFGTEAQVRGVKVGAELVRDKQGRSTVDRSSAGRADRTARVENPTATASDVGFTVWTKYDAFDEEAFNAASPRPTRSRSRSSTPSSTTASWPSTPTSWPSA